MSSLNEEISSTSESLKGIQSELTKTLETFDRLELETAEKKEAESKLSERVNELTIETNGLEQRKRN